MPFTDEQIKNLGAKLNGRHVRTRRHNGMALSYIEGWHVIAEANRIFGFDGWNRETVNASCVWQGTLNGQKACSYVAKVRVFVRTGGKAIVREGNGAGHGLSSNPGEAHESAIKEAETDAMKRALVTFGNQFGLALYDKNQSEVRYPRKQARKAKQVEPITWVLRSADGKPLGSFTDPREFFSEARKAIECTKTKVEIEAFSKFNDHVIGQLKQALPDLATDDGKHYSDVFGSLVSRRMADLVSSTAKDETTGTRSVGRCEQQSPGRRLRDRGHLRFVAKQPCLVCERTPTQAHHIRFAQLRALSRKVSDEWTVPLCAGHHRAVHDAGDEREWWKKLSVDPIPIARDLWQRTRSEWISSSAQSRVASDEGSKVA